MSQRWGLTGGIGSGKSTVSTMLQTCGAVVIDTDALSRALTAPGGAALPAIRTAFGASMIDAHGALDRARMRSLVFGDAGAKLTLEAIMHPLIGDETQRLAQSAIDAQAPVVVFDVPLLAESKSWRDRVDKVIVVDCLESTQVARVSHRPGWSVQAAQGVLSQQATRTQRRAIADAVIHNDGIDLHALDAHVKDLWLRWAVHIGGADRL